MKAFRSTKEASFSLCSQQGHACSTHTGSSEGPFHGARHPHPSTGPICGWGDHFSCVTELFWLAGWAALSRRRPRKASVPCPVPLGRGTAGQWPKSPDWSGLSGVPEGLAAFGHPLFPEPSASICFFRRWTVDLEIFVSSAMSRMDCSLSNSAFTRESSHVRCRGGSIDVGH